ncbi:hypothetical protein ASE86_07005 [Sphingomonas sp. Leaf33]|uniref:hypothetical protein n=1 Tax=Sphingomonas sp. Leaf33 TaxID=1736215 RepID=UPI000701AFBA|nr:hypothetical protein [Sphingomonas sp. Leaf33]KQN25928.1 hypothetical protein ASE86_07005 [Sphingomonas sp. Leaf33]
MNDATPHRLTGSLVERAAHLWDLAPPPLAYEGPPAPRVAPETTPFGAVSEPAAAPIPRARHRRGTPVAIDRARLRQHGLIVPGTAITALAEEFRLVKRNLLNTARTLTDDAVARSILICSARPDEGKTFCAINLALSLAAERDVEVLLVDADFAKPDVFDTLGVTSEAPGLLDAIADPFVDVESGIVDTDVPNLTLLGAGRRSNDDTELLASARAAEVLRALTIANPDRIVIFDSPPALAASPAAVLAQHVGQTMLVVRADRTSESDLREAVTLLGACDHIGLVLNSVVFQPGGRRFGYYGQEAAE